MSAEILAVAVHASSPLEHVSLSGLKGLYLGTSQMISGIRLEPMDLSARLPAREGFTRVVTGLSLQGLKEHWIKLSVYEGKARNKPAVYRSPLAVQVLLERYPNRIGYFPWDPSMNEDSRFKLLRVEGLLPGDPGYPLVSP